jgi:hypothetical protein
MIPVANVEFILADFTARLGDPYVYGGDYSPTNTGEGCDCSYEVGWVLEGLTKGPAAMSWAHNVSTESWPYDYSANTPAAPGTVGPYGTIAIATPADAPADAALIINIHHGGGGEDSHMNCYLAGEYLESNGTYGTCTATHATLTDSTYWTDHWILPGPIDGAVTVTAPQPSDTLFADVSEFQTPVDDSYWQATFTAGNGVSGPFRWLSIRSNDGDHQDANFPTNYARAVQALNDGRADGLIVYYYWRPGETGLDTHMSMVTAAGGPHPHMVSMMDIESGGNPSGDESTVLDDEYAKLQAWLGNPDRVIGYANLGDERTMWQFKPQHVPFILAGYGSNPTDPGVFKIAHQYTDGTGYGAASGLPDGAPPFGKCDMNSADGFTSAQLALALGITTTNATPPPAPPLQITEDQMADIVSLAEQIRAKQDGVAATDDGSVKKGQPYPYLLVSQDRPRVPLDEPVEQSATPSGGDHTVHVAKHVTGRLWLDGETALDVWDMLALYVLNLVEVKGLAYVKGLIATCPAPPAAAVAAKQASDAAGLAISWDTD